MGVLELEQVSVTYSTPHGDIHALDELNVMFEAGTATAVLGRSGSGKSTLVSVVAQLRQVTTGVVRVAGLETQHMSPKGRTDLRRDHIGIVFQSLHLEPALSVLDNVLLSWHFNPGGVKHSVARQRALADLESLGLAEMSDRHVNMLSGGQRQRVAIARAMFSRPSILLADEPTGALDESTAADVVAALIRPTRSEGTCLILVTHDQAVAREADRMIHLSMGRLTVGVK